VTTEETAEQRQRRQHFERFERLRIYTDLWREDKDSEGDVEEFGEIRRDLASNDSVEVAAIQLRVSVHIAQSLSEIVELLAKIARSQEGGENSDG